MVGTGGAVTVGLDGRTEAREQNSSHPSVGIVGLRHHWGHLVTRLKLEKCGSQKNHKIGIVNERPVSEQFPLICRHRGLVRAGKWKLGNWVQQLIWVGRVGRETKRSHPCGGIEASFLGGGMQLNYLIPKNLHSLALRANMGPSCWLLIDDSRIPTRNPYFITPLIFHCSRYAWLLWVFASCFVVANMNSFQADSSPLFLNARELSSFSDTVNC